MVFTNKSNHNRTVYPPLYFNGHRIDKVDQHTHLGLTLSENMTWTNHITRITNKTWPKVDSLKRIRHKVPKHTLIHLYKIMIRPTLEYGAVIYNNCSNADSIVLESVQRAAALTCTGAYKRTETTKLMDELGWETLQTRRHCQLLTLFFKILNNLTPPYLRELLPPQVADRSHYNTRNKFNFSTPSFRTRRYQTSFRFYASKTWNSLPDILKNVPIFTIFINKIKNLYYKTHNHLFCLGQLKGQGSLIIQD